MTLPEFQHRGKTVPSDTCDDEYCWCHKERQDKLAAAEARVKEMEAVVKLLRDDEYADKIATTCFDPAHDPRWCSTCESRGNGIESYRQRLLAALAAARAASEVTR